MSKIGWVWDLVSYILQTSILCSAFVRLPYKKEQCLETLSLPDHKKAPEAFISILKPFYSYIALLQHSYFFPKCKTQEDIRRRTFIKSVLFHRHGETNSANLITRLRSTIMCQDVRFDMRHNNEYLIAHLQCFCRELVEQSQRLVLSCLYIMLNLLACNFVIG